MKEYSLRKKLFLTLLLLIAFSGIAEGAARMCRRPPTAAVGGKSAWSEDFRTSMTASGLQLFADNAVTRRIAIGSATGVWPSGITHVAENVYTAGMNSAYQAKNLWPAPAVGEYLFARMLVNNSLPKGANTGGDHGFQTNAIAPVMWFWRIWGGDADSFNIEFGTWDRANVTELRVDVPKNRVLRMEWRVNRTTSSTAIVSARVYNNETGALLGQIGDLPQTGLTAAHFREFLFGMSGQGGASFNGGSVYWGALAFRVSSDSTKWIGPYPAAGVER
jgi:hypothetical protein